jgi:cytochrome c oxidase assembly factor CtaG
MSFGVAWTDFTYEPTFIVLALVAALLYARAARREHVPGWKVVLFAVSLVLIVAALNSPLETIAVHYLLLGHLVQNALIADWAPPLLILGLTDGMRRAVERAGGTIFEAVTRPAVALPLWLVAWYGTHLPSIYDGALRNPAWLNVEHGVLILAGLLFWWPVLAGGERALSAGGALGYLAAAFVTAVFLGLALTFDGNVIYTYYVDKPRLLGMSPQEDQNVAGAVMNGEQSVVFIAAIAYVFFKLAGQEADEPEAIDPEIARHAHHVDGR